MMTQRQRTPHIATAASSPENLSGPALRAFFRLADAWKLSTDESRVLLGEPGRSTFFKWKADKAGPIPRDTLERISYLLGIFKALAILFPDDSQADAWVRRPNAASLFGGKSALDRMLQGHVADLLAVRQYLDAQRG